MFGAAASPKMQLNFEGRMKLAVGFSLPSLSTYSESFQRYNTLRYSAELVDFIKFHSIPASRPGEIKCILYC